MRQSNPDEALSLLTQATEIFAAIGAKGEKPDAIQEILRQLEASSTNR